MARAASLSVALSLHQRTTGLARTLSPVLWKDSDGPSWGARISFHFREVLPDNLFHGVLDAAHAFAADLLEFEQSHMDCGNSRLSHGVLGSRLFREVLNQVLCRRGRPDY
jgi:hypothetical protein